MTGTKSKFFHRFFSSRLFLFVGGTALVLVIVGFARAEYQQYKTHQEIQSLEDTVVTLKQKRFESLQYLTYVLSEHFVEEKARTELNLKKPGEHVLVVPEDATTKSAVSSRAIKLLDRVAGSITACFCLKCAAARLPISP